MDHEYTTPTIDEAGSASELIKAYAGPRSDGGGYIFSEGASTVQDE